MSLMPLPDRPLSALATLDVEDLPALPAVDVAAPRPAEPLPAPSPDVRVRMEDLVRRYGKLIAAMVRRVGRNAAPHLREDIQQRVLIALWKQLRREKTIEHPTTYIYRSAVRETMRVLQQEAARAQDPIEGEEPAALRTERGDPHAALDRKEKMERIRAAIATIGPERRLAVWAHLSGFDETEIMHRYGWSYQKARNLVARGMADLRLILKENGLAPRA
jgi:RNA polymerase sigma factor (sigma-70 family)